MEIKKRGAAAGAAVTPGAEVLLVVVMGQVARRKGNPRPCRRTMGDHCSAPVVIHVSTQQVAARAACKPGQVAGVHSVPAGGVRI